MGEVDLKGNLNVAPDYETRESVWGGDKRDEIRRALIGLNLQVSGNLRIDGVTFVPQARPSGKKVGSSEVAKEVAEPTFDTSTTLPRRRSMSYSSREDSMRPSLPQALQEARQSQWPLDSSRVLTSSSDSVKTLPKGKASARVIKADGESLRIKTVVKAPPIVQLKKSVALGRASSGSESSGDRSTPLGPVKLAAKSPTSAYISAPKVVTPKKVPRPRFGSKESLDVPESAPTRPRVAAAKASLAGVDGQKAATPSEKAKPEIKTAGPKHRTPAKLSSGESASSRRSDNQSSEKDSVIAVASSKAPLSKKAPRPRFGSLDLQEAAPKGPERKTFGPKQRPPAKLSSGESTRSVESAGRGRTTVSQPKAVAQPDANVRRPRTSVSSKSSDEQSTDSVKATLPSRPRKMPPPPLPGRREGTPPQSEASKPQLQVKVLVKVKAKKPTAIMVKADSPVESVVSTLPDVLRSEASDPEEGVFGQLAFFSEQTPKSFEWYELPQSLSPPKSSETSQLPQSLSPPKSFDSCELPQQSQGSSETSELPQQSQGSSDTSELPQQSQGSSDTSELPQRSQGSSETSELPQSLYASALSNEFNQPSSGRRLVEILPVHPGAPLRRFASCKFAGQPRPTRFLRSSTIDPQFASPSVTSAPRPLGSMGRPAQTPGADLQGPKYSWCCCEATHSPPEGEP